MAYQKLKLSFYQQADVVSVSKQLLGKVLCSNINGEYCSGIITETEAYAGESDKASHAYQNKKTQRNQNMFSEGGISYVYLCYGIHHLFNVVTNVSEVPHAILIRGIFPLEEKHLMMERRAKNSLHPKEFKGPGKVSQAMGIDMSHNGISLLGNQIWIEDRNFIPHENDIKIGPRVGIDYAEEDALLPYRFEISPNERIYKLIS